MTFSTTPVIRKSVKDLAFLAGAWQGENGTDLFEEHWMLEVQNNMTGMFRWLKDGEIFVYEIMALVEREGNIHLLLRHFNKDFVGWEEKEESLIFILSELTDTKALFIKSNKPEDGWLMYERVDDKTLKFTDLESDGSVSFELTFIKQG